MLTRMGHSVVLAENGQQAVDKWRATMPPVISTPMNVFNSITLSWSSVSLQALVPNPSLITKLGSPPLMTGLAQAFDICLMDLSMPVFGDLISFGENCLLELYYLHSFSFDFLLFDAQLL